MAKPKPTSPFLGHRHIISMSEWDEDYINAEVPAFIEFNNNGYGSFQFGYVRGGLERQDRCP